MLDPLDEAASAHPTLQDYWRRDPDTGAELNDAELKASGHLVTSPDRTVWHLAHLPQRGKDGSLLKTAFNGVRRRLLRNVVASRLLAATREAADGGAPTPLDGIVAPDVDIGEEVAFLHPIRSRRSEWGFVQMYGRFSEIDFSYANLDGLKFSGSCFPHGRILRELRTLGDIDLSSCDIAAVIDLARIVAGGFLDLSGSHLAGRSEADSAFVHRNLRLYKLVATADVDLTYLHVHGNTWVATSGKERAATFDACLVATSAEPVACRQPATPSVLQSTFGAAHSRRTPAFATPACRRRWMGARCFRPRDVRAAGGLEGCRDGLALCLRWHNFQAFGPAGPDLA